MTADPTASEWDTCSVSGCKGRTAGGMQMCLAHLDDAGLDAALARLGPGSSLDVRGVTFDDTLLRRVVEACRDSAGRARLGNVSLQDAHFRERLFLADATVEGMCNFDDATFDESATFTNVVFAGDTSLARTSFTDIAFFACSFHGRVNLDAANGERVDISKSEFRAPVSCHALQFSQSFWALGARFHARAEFDGMKGGSAHFGGVEFDDYSSFQGTELDLASFDRVKFDGDAWFRVAVTKSISFSDAVFAELLSFSHSVADMVDFRAQFGGDAYLEVVAARHLSMGSSRFARRVWLGPIVADSIFLDLCAFAEPVDAMLYAKRLQSNDTVYGAPCHIGVADANMSMAGARFIAPTIVFDASQSFPFDRLDPDQTVTSRSLSSPDLVTLERADVSGLLLVGVKLEACRFTNAHNLDKLRLEGGCDFATTPPGWRWMRRKTMAEEHSWRARHHRSANQRGWDAHRRWSAEDGFHLEDQRTAADNIANLYRSLRKGREDNKDEPGAADFYYGEMEMRRHSPTVEFGERAILTLYWLCSGYGLRAWRALMVLGLVVLISALLFMTWGFAGASGAGPHAYAEAVIYCLRTAVGLLQGPQPILTLTGDVLQIMLRISAPVLLGLAALALRGRVRR